MLQTYLLDTVPGLVPEDIKQKYPNDKTGQINTLLGKNPLLFDTYLSGAIEVDERDVEGRAGLALPALYAMSATRYEEVHGLTREVMAAVSVKNHSHGVHNERAQYVEAVTLEQVLGSRMIADPLTLLQCCPVTDAAAALRDVLGERCVLTPEFV